MDEAPALPTQKSASTQRILSIDMGVRNLAYCLLQVDAASARSKKAPKLIAWERLSLIGGEKGVTEDGTAQTKLPASAFSPPTMAVAAARLIRGRLLPLAPTHVLIERQRFRSGGGAAVLEWTVRVNSLEAMLHGIFAYRQLDVSTSGENTVQTVQAVNPQRVSQFLLRGGLGDSSGSQTPSLPAKSTKEKYIKDVKETFVAGILRSTGPQKLLTYDERINSIVDAYLLRWDAKQSKSRKKVKTNVTEEKEPTSSPKPVFSKIDDLADCVAQGLAWLEWEDNRRILREMGAERLLVAKKIAG
ncbi:hypothetical protein SEUCBS139899_007339 [Sporothrix eucalyptigena]|uniref:Mitochondrial resolvase Ydc2 catalytic domain-containing protein n=1 Tax=Sporothrix eucalyptigena TaxID=1812306 RepID=A0ABP0CCU0_9PEZI